ncbi:MAG TPA: cytochrome ubiquinol oxidase subunit I [Thermoanaerobaculia bacterium]|nr:cytochrome ubiquinol oxidase subunit I [Thermoanaerobaculia bacterium]
MTDLLAARSQMAISLMFHILFAIAGMAMPVLMVVSEALWLRTGRTVYLDLTRRWAKGTAILFAVGAVSGTVLSFELGLLWPKFMEHAGAIIGMPFSLEGFAFFTEAIFLGIYLYGWDRVAPRAHLAAGVVVAVSGGLSAVFVVTANAWMNTPVGFELVDGRMTNIDPVAAMLSPAAFPEALHMLLAAYAAVGFAVAGIHAFVLLRHPGDPFHRAALAIALLVGGPAALLQPVSGDSLARMVAKTQPAKLAALEGQFATERGAPLRLGGLPDPERRTTRWAIEIPYGLSLLAHHDPHATIVGLNDIPRESWPNPVIVHPSFQIMIACGTAMALLALAAGFLAWRRRHQPDRLPDQRWLLRSLVFASPLGVLGLEAGWFVTELGRQPWIIQGVMRTRDALTPMPGLTVPLVTITLVYLALGLIVIVLLRRHVISTVPSVPV